MIVSEEAKPWLKFGFPVLRPRLLFYGPVRYGLVLSEAHHDDVGTIVVVDQQTWNDVMDVGVEHLPDSLWVCGKNWLVLSR